MKNWGDGWCVCGEEGAFCLHPRRWERWGGRWSSWDGPPSPQASLTLLSSWLVKEFLARKVQLCWGFCLESLHPSATTQVCTSCHWTIQLNKVKIVCFILCDFYYNKETLKKKKVNWNFTHRVACSLPCPGLVSWTRALSTRAAWCSHFQSTYSKPWDRTSLLWRDYSTPDMVPESSTYGPLAAGKNSAFIRDIGSLSP